MRGEFPAMRFSTGTAAFLLAKYRAKVADNFPNKTDHGVASSNPLLLHHPVPQFSDLSENRSKSARVRAICDHAWTQRTPSAARIRRIQQNLSGRDLARSMDHRRKFACSWNPANRPLHGLEVMKLIRVGFLAPHPPVCSPCSEQGNCRAKALAPAGAAGNTLWTKNLPKILPEAVRSTRRVGIRE